MRKPIIIILFALLGILSARAADFTVNGIYYNILSGTDAPQVEVTKVTSGSVKYSGSVVIPTTVEYDGTTYSVTAIGDEAFMYCSDLTSVTIGEGVTSIGYYAFCLCSGLTSVTIPNSVTSIGILAFNGCSSLTSVTIPNSVTTIRADAFSNCSGLTSVTIPESVTSIGNNAFKGCSSLTSVEWNAINCQNFTASSTHFPNTLSSITFGDKVESIPAYLCYEQSSLTSVTIPNSVTSIGNSAFSTCSGLTSVTIGEGVTSIGEGAFRNCSDLTSVTIPEGVTSVGAFVFSGTGLTSVEWNARNCPNRYMSSLFPSTLTSITFGDEVELIPAYLCFGCSGLESVTIPNGVTSIGNYAFYNCSGLTSVTIPEGVTSVGAFVFNGTGLTSVEWNAQNCPNRYISPMFPNTITSITFGDKVELIPAYMCKGCSGLTSVTIPNSMITINDQAFSGCGGLTSVTIGEGVTSIGNSAFYDCSALTSVTSLATVPPTCGSNAFAVHDNDTLYVPCGSKTAYEGAEGWSSFSEIIGIGCVYVTLSVNDETMGSVTGEKEYALNEQATLEAIPNEGYHFVKWSDDNTDNPRVLTVTQDTSLMAVFAKDEEKPDDPVVKTFTLSVSANNPAWGSVSQSGNGTYDSASLVTIIATANEGYRFVNWTKGDAVFGTKADTTFAIKENLELVANFEKIPDEPIVVKTFTLSVSVNNPAWGSASQSGNGTYDSASSVRITATPNEGYRFVNWTKGTAVFSAQADTTFTITENLALLANFEKVPDEPVVVKTFTLSVSANKPAWGNVSQSGTGTYDSASSVTITATANEGYRFVNWTKGNAVFSAHADTTFAIKENLELVANFEKIPDEPIVVKTFMLRISVNNPAWGSASQSGNGTYDSASSVTITATPNEGYRFVNWREADGSVFGTKADTTFAIKENLELVANFEKIPDEPVANENRQDDHFRIYAQGRTIYLSEDRGLVQVYNMAGQCVYNGHATAIPVRQSGVYIIAVGSQRIKVLVR